MVSVLVPWRAGCPHREAAWEWVQHQYREAHPDWEIVTGTCSDGLFNRSEAIGDAVRKSSGDVLVVADSDVWADPAPAIVPALEHGWAIPHCMIHRLSQESTALVLAGAEWRGLPLSTENPQDRRAYRGHEAGTLTVFRRDLLEAIPYDSRFVGWGGEDDALAAALHTLHGRPWRGTDDLVHLWHPSQPRQSRTIGSVESFRLWRQYRNAKRSPDLMRQVIEEGRCSNSTVSTLPASLNS